MTTDLTFHRQLCGVVSTLVARAHACPQAVPDFASQQLPLLLQGLLWFSSTAPPLQVPAIRAAAHCHAHFTSGHAHHRQALLKWAESAIFNSYGPLSLVSPPSHTDNIFYCHDAGCLVDVLVTQISKKTSA